jgi:hypothetical protein
MAIVIFIAGFMIGRYFRFSQHCKHSTTDSPHQGSVYEDVQPSTEENLEPNVNVAYSSHHPSKSVISLAIDDVTMN